MRKRNIFKVLMFVLVGLVISSCGPKHSHEFGEATYSWAEDYSSVTAERACSCGEKETETATSSSAEKSPATCTANQVVTYTVTFENAAFASQSKDVEVSGTKLGHTFAEPVYVWADDNSTVKASRTCSCGEVEEETVNTTTVEKSPASCLANQVLTYKAEFTNQAFALQTKDVEIAESRLTHNLVEVPAVPGDCTHTGVKAYYVCDRSGCDATFEDVDGLKPIADLEAWKLADGKTDIVHVSSGNPQVVQKEGVWYYEDICSSCAQTYYTPIETHTTQDVKEAVKDEEVSNVALTIVGFCGTNGFAQGKIGYLVAFDGARAMTLKTTNFTVDGYTIKWGDRLIELGDTMLVETMVREGNYYMHVKEQTKVYFGEKVDVSTFDPEKFISIKDKTTETNLYAYDIGGFYKLTATEEHPLYISGLKATASGVTYNFLNIFGDGNGQLTPDVLAGYDKTYVKYPNPSNAEQFRTPGSVVPFWQLNLGDQWLIDNLEGIFTMGQDGLEGHLMNPDDQVPLGTYAFKGTCYLYTMYAGSAGVNAYQTAYILPVGFNLTRIVPAA